MKDQAPELFEGPIMQAAAQGTTSTFLYLLACQSLLYFTAALGKPLRILIMRLNKQRVFWALRSLPTPCALLRTFHSFLFGNVYCVL